MEPWSRIPERRAALVEFVSPKPPAAAAGWRPARTVALPFYLSIGRCAVEAVLETLAHRRRVVAGAAGARVYCRLLLEDGRR